MRGDCERSGATQFCGLIDAFAIITRTLVRRRRYRVDERGLRRQERELQAFPGLRPKYLPDRAHDIAFTKRVGSAEPIRVGSAFTRERFVTTPVAWTRVADAATIAALQVPGADGTKVDVFKSSVAVAREVGQYLHDHL